MSLTDLMPNFMAKVKEQIVLKGKPILSDIHPVYRVTNYQPPIYSDFLSQEEEEPCESTETGKYSCSVFLGQKGQNKLKNNLKNYPTLRDKHNFISIGKIRENTGLYSRKNSTNHIHWWIFQDCKSKIAFDFTFFSTIENFL